MPELQHRAVQSTGCRSEEHVPDIPAGHCYCHRVLVDVSRGTNCWARAVDSARHNQHTRAAFKCASVGVWVCVVMLEQWIVLSAQYSLGARSVFRIGRGMQQTLGRSLIASDFLRHMCPMTCCTPSLGSLGDTPVAATIVLAWRSEGETATTSPTYRCLSQHVAFPLSVFGFSRRQQALPYCWCA